MNKQAYQTNNCKMCRNIHSPTMMTFPIIYVCLEHITERQKPYRIITNKLERQMELAKQEHRVPMLPYIFKIIKETFNKECCRILVILHMSKVCLVQGNTVVVKTIRTSTNRAALTFMVNFRSFFCNGLIRVLASGKREF